MTPSAISSFTASTYPILILSRLPSSQSGLTKTINSINEYKKKSQMNYFTNHQNAEISSGKTKEIAECTDRELNPGYWLGRPKSYH